MINGHHVRSVVTWTAASGPSVVGGPLLLFPWLWHHPASPTPDQWQDDPCFVTWFRFWSAAFPFGISNKNGLVQVVWRCLKCTHSVRFWRGCNYTLSRRYEEFLGSLSEHHFSKKNSKKHVQVSNGFPMILSAQFNLRSTAEPRFLWNAFLCQPLLNQGISERWFTPDTWKARKLFAVPIFKIHVFIVILSMFANFKSTSLRRSSRSWYYY